MNEEPEGKGSLGRGFLIASGLNLSILVLFFLVIFSLGRFARDYTGGIPSGISALLLFGFGLTQFLWLTPLYLNYRKKRQSETSKGILLAAGITFLLNGACWATGLMILKDMFHPGR